jgi:hypothetical protein
VLINNAGIARDAMVWKLTDDQWNSVLAVHLTGTFLLTRAAVPEMRRRAFGRIVNVTSYTGLHGNIGQANYAAAKAAIVGFTKTAAKDLARFGITVNAISPNARTPMVSAVPDEQFQRLAAAISLGRFAEPAEICPGLSASWHRTRPGTSPGLCYRSTAGWRCEPDDHVFGPSRELRGWINRPDSISALNRRTIAAQPTSSGELLAQLRERTRTWRKQRERSGA